MSTAKSVHELFIWFLSKLDRFYQLAKSDLYGAWWQSEQSGVWNLSLDRSFEPPLVLPGRQVGVFSSILYRWRISVHFEFLPQKSLIRYTERDRMEFNTSSCLAVLSSWNLESLNSICSSPWYFPSYSWFYFQISCHYSEIRGLFLMKWPSKTLQDLPYFWNMKTQEVFCFSFRATLFSLLMNALVNFDFDIDQGIY